MPHVRVFPCPRCQEFIASDAKGCRFCSAPIDAGAAESAADAQDKENRRYMRRRYARHMLVGAGLFAAGVVVTLITFGAAAYSEGAGASSSCTGSSSRLEMLIRQIAREEAEKVSAKKQASGSDEWLTVGQAAEMTNLSQWHVRKFIKNLRAANSPDVYQPNGPSPQSLRIRRIALRGLAER